MTTDTPSSRDEEIPTPKLLADRITNYLGSGGLFNPELAIHERVRDLLMECRECLIRLSAEREKERAAFESVSNIANGRGRRIGELETICLRKDNQVDKLKATLAERDNQLADERLNYGAQVACIQGLENELAEVKAKLSEYKRREQSQFESEQEGDMEK